MILATVVTAGLGGGCGPLTAAGESADDLALVVTQVPAGVGYTSDVGELSPNLKYPEGSRVILVPASGTADRAITLSEGLAAAGAPAVAPAGDAILFAGKPTTDSRWGIYEIDASGGRRRLLVQTDRDCTDPAYLAANRIVFACADALPEAVDYGLSRWSLYTASRDGSEPVRITFGPGSAADPTPLRDGRVLFSMQQGPADGAAAARSALFTVNPDGTLLDPFAGNEKQRDAREMQQHRLDADVRQTLRDDPRWHEADVLQTLPDDPQWHEVEVVALLPSPAPRTRPSSVDHGSTTGTLICYDAARSDGVVGPPVDGPTPTKVVVQTLSAAPPTSDASAGGPTPAPGTVGAGALPGRVAVDLGTTAVGRDGSFYLEVPADTPLRIRTLRQDGGEIATSSWFWVRPGEVRACFGCHEGHEAAPVNRPIEAITRPPIRVGGNPGGGTR
jgi:hypothetical protein